MADFKRINELVGERYTDNELKEMIDFGDKDRDGFVNWEEFRTVVLKEYPKAWLKFFINQ